jgi:hypothetical protein
LGDVFSLGSVLRVYNVDQLPLSVSQSRVQVEILESPEAAVSSVEGWCEMAASLRGREPGCRGPYTIGRSYQAAE